MPKLVKLIGPSSTLTEELSHASLDLLQHHPCACESSCQVLRLPSWQDVAVELHPHLVSAHPFWRATEYDLDHSSILRWHPSMRAAQRQGVLGWFAVEQGLCQGCVLPSLVFNIFFAAVINVASTRFKEDKGIMDALVHLRKKKGAKGRGEATTGESVLATPLWGMLYADGAEVVS